MLELNGPTTPNAANSGKDNETQSGSEPAVAKPEKLKGGQIVIRDNQSGISYENLFGRYLTDATNIVVTDPYVRLPYQLRNFMEFAKLISIIKTSDNEVNLHLVTNNNEDYIQESKDAFRSMTYSMESVGINFSYEFNEIIHDRSIVLNNGWKIILGRGLDIWQKTGGWFDMNEYLQEQRLCKGCEITFVGK